MVLKSGTGGWVKLFNGVRNLTGLTGCRLKMGFLIKPRVITCHITKDHVHGKSVLHNVQNYYLLRNNRPFVTFPIYIIAIHEGLHRDSDIIEIIPDHGSYYGGIKYFALFKLKKKKIDGT